MQDMSRSSQSKERRAKNEWVFKKINIKTRRSIERGMDDSSRDTFPLSMLCECSDLECTARLDVTVSQRKGIVHDPNNFIIVPGHVDPPIEDVIQKQSHYWVVSKHPELISDMPSI